MILFLDTEWADDVARDYVSIGLTSADDQHQYHAEVKPLPESAKPFVETVVYPLLERGAAVMPTAAMGKSLRTFVACVTIVTDEAPTIAFDHQTDKAFFTQIYRVNMGHVRIPVNWLDLESGDNSGTLANHSELHFRANPTAAAQRHHALVDATIAARA